MGKVSNYQGEVDDYNISNALTPEELMMNPHKLHLGNERI
jgi:hypothetical protein